MNQNISINDYETNLKIILKDDKHFFDSELFYEYEFLLREDEKYDVLDRLLKEGLRFYIKGNIWSSPLRIGSIILSSCAYSRYCKTKMMEKEFIEKVFLLLIEGRDNFKIPNEDINLWTGCYNEALGDIYAFYDKELSNKYYTEAKKYYAKVDNQTIQYAIIGEYEFSVADNCFRNMCDIYFNNSNPFEGIDRIERYEMVNKKIEYIL